MVIAREKGGWVGESEQRGNKWEQKETLGVKHVMQYADITLLSCTSETYMVVLTDVTPINLIKF